MKRIYEFLIYIYRVYILKIKLSNKEKSKYASFGYNSEVELPYLNINNQNLITIGSGTTILKGARIQLFPDLVEHTPHIKIGDNCYIGYNVTLLAGADIIIEDGVLFASNILVTSENHGIDPTSETYYMDQPLVEAPVRIGMGTWIGEKVSVMPGVTIGKKCVIGAGSVVTKSIPDFCVAVGSPARIVKRFDFNFHRWVKVIENEKK